MKKLLIVLLAFAMLLCSCFAAVAEMPELSAADFSVDFQIPGKADVTKDSSISDIVVINDNSYSVITPEGIVIDYTAPNSNVFCLTQDYVHQYDLYSAFYDNSIETVANFIDSGMHFNIYDPVNEIDMYLYIGTSGWASIFPNTASLSDEEAAYILDYMETNLVDNVSASTYGYAGGNIYFYLDCSADGAAYLLTSINGYEILICYRAKNSDAALAGVALLDNLTMASI